MIVPDLPNLPAFEPLHQLAAKLDGLRAQGRRNATALARIPLDRRRAEAERLDQFSDALRSGKTGIDADPGDAAIRRIDAERDQLLRERDAIRLAEAKVEADWRAYVAAHGRELRRAALAAREEARAHALEALKDFRQARDEVDRLNKAIGVAVGAKSPRGLATFLTGKVTPGEALDLLAESLGPDRRDDDEAVAEDVTEA